MRLVHLLLALMVLTLQMELLDHGVRVLNKIAFVPTDAPNDATSNTPTKSPTNVPSDVPSKAPIESSVIPSIAIAGAPSSIRVVPSSGSTLRLSLPLTTTPTISPSKVLIETPSMNCTNDDGFRYKSDSKKDCATTRVSSKFRLSF